MEQIFRGGTKFSEKIVPGNKIFTENFVPLEQFFPDQNSSDRPSMADVVNIMSFDAKVQVMDSAISS